MGDAPSPSVVCFDPKKGEENFARLCQFLMTICGDILRVVLSHYIKPGDLRSELDINQSKLDRITNTQEKDLLYPPHSSTTSSPPIRSRDLDLSLLYKILRNICNISKHRAGWGNPPVSGDYCVSACIERIRLLRNSISGHSTNGTIGDVHFEDYWQELRTSVVEIEKEVIGSDKYERGIDHLHDCDLNPTKSKEYVAQIRRLRGEVSIKRERIDMVEHACIEIGEENEAKKEILTAAKEEILKEMKSSELRIQQKINKSDCTSTDRTPSAKFKNIQITRTTTTKIKFEKIYSDMRLSPTFDKKCWLGFHYNGKDVSLYLLNDSNVIKEVLIPYNYAPSLLCRDVATNDKGEAVFTSDKSVVAATQDGTVYKLFDIPFLTTKFCILHSGNYCFVTDLFSLTKSVRRCLSIHEFSANGVRLRVINNIEEIDIWYVSSIRQNHNGDIVITDSKSLIILRDDFSLKHRIPITEGGVVLPCMNSRSDLLCGHRQTIDLLRNNGEFVNTVYKTQIDKNITSIAFSVDGTAWILYHTNELEILELEI
ncbi:uncharacterized protein LOC125660883 isoform X2 [Ostrea edulis]|uniref:uncharacterized protein LOC125660883 isoform X2 n=1 Tax=Ostrea edulis TaxID=37623 RepID=UPI0020956A58|nr:uncharacterized protein LOC125660883 isoform X2 [Ostrea edulis]